MLALSSACAPDAVLGDVPLVYPFVVNDPGEGVQAKRRAHAVIVDHLVPPMMRADTYDELAELETLLDEYARLEVARPAEAARARARGSGRRSSARTCRPTSASMSGRMTSATLVEHIDGYLCEIKDIQVKDGLHVLGRAPEGEQLRRPRRRDAARCPVSLRAACGAVFGLDEPALVAQPGARVDAPPAELLERFRGPAASAGDLVDRLEAAQTALLDALAARGWQADGVCAEVLGREDARRRGAAALRVRRGRPALPPHRRRDRPRARRAATAATCPPGPSGSPTRGRLDVLPTGRNFYSVDPRALPVRALVGGRAAARRRAARAPPGARPASSADGRARRRGGRRRCARRATTSPRSSRCSACGPSGTASRGASPASRSIALEELGRPRIDVTVRISGFFRDAFPHLVRLLDDAVDAVAALDEPDEQNFVAAHARADAASSATGGGRHDAHLRLQAGDVRRRPAPAARRRATGAATPTSPRSTRPGAATRTGAGSTARRRATAMRGCYARIDVAVKNVDNREHDILDSDDYYQYHGGMVATVRALTGREPGRVPGRQLGPVAGASRARWPRRRGACSARASPTRAGSRR